MLAPFRVALVIGLLACASAYGQLSQSGSSGITQAQLDAMQATVMAAMPQPADIIPPPDTLTGTPGSGSGLYLRPTAARPTISQRARIMTDASGNWAVTWAKPFTGNDYSIDLTTISNTQLRSMCQVFSTSTTAASGSCWRESTVSQAVVKVLGIDVLSNVTQTQVPYASGQVSVIGIEKSQ